MCSPTQPCSISSNRTTRTRSNFFHQRQESSHESHTSRIPRNVFELVPGSGARGPLRKHGYCQRRKPLSKCKSERERNRNANVNRNVNVNQNVNVNRNVNVHGGYYGGGCCYYHDDPNWGAFAAGAAVGVATTAVVAAATRPWINHGRCAGTARGFNDRSVARRLRYCICRRCGDLQLQQRISPAFLSGNELGLPSSYLSVATANVEQSDRIPQQGAW